MAKNDTKNVIDDTVVETEMNENEKVSKKAAKVEPLMDSDEIEVVSLIPNVSYKDSKTLDMYYWDEVGHIEYMNFETLKNMWRNNKGYFKNLWLKPNDDRVVNKFGLTKTFERYEYLMKASNYTKKNIDAICEAISNTPNGLKFSICDKIKNMVIDGEISDISVIKRLGDHLKIDLVNFS